MAKDFLFSHHILGARKSIIRQPVKGALTEEIGPLVHPFREQANSKAHNLLDYAGSMRDVRNAKVSEMVELLLTHGGGERQGTKTLKVLGTLEGAGGERS